jgi:hypothetical protein
MSPLLIISHFHILLPIQMVRVNSLFGWLVADGWCWFVLREEYCWLVASGWFVVREKYCWLVADKPSEQGERSVVTMRSPPPKGGPRLGTTPPLYEPCKKL